MILVVCLNPALDITHYVPQVDWTGVNRPSQVHARPGGKGLNVARTLHALQAGVLVMGLAGGVTGAGVAAGLSELGVPAAFTAISGETRRTFTVVDGQGGGAALFNEPGPAVGADELGEFRVQYEKALAGAAAVVLSGSLPPGVPAGSYATLIELAAAAGVPAVLDAHGAALRQGAAARPAIVKPNLAELAELAGRPLAGPAGDGGLGDGGLGDDGSGDGRPGAAVAAVAAAAGGLRAAGAQAVVVSLGAAGLLAVTAEGTWAARPPAPVAGNATGAGDAVTAGLAHGLVLGRPWPRRLAHAVALGTAAAAAPVAGEFSAADYARLLGQVTVEPAGDF